jgi:hypothetical protein
LDECVETLLEEDFIDPVFGTKSKLRADEFVR